MNEELFAAALKIGFGALAGGLTNSIAIWMLFHPYKSPKLFNRWRIGFLQGAIPKNQPRLAAAIGRTVGDRLLTQEDLTETFTDATFRKAFDERLSGFLDGALRTDRGSLRELIPASVMENVEELIDEGIDKGMLNLDEYLVSDSFDESMGRRALDLVEAIRDEPIGGILTPARGEAVEAAVQDWLQNAVESDDFTAAVDD